MNYEMQAHGDEVIFTQPSDEAPAELIQTEDVVDPQIRRYLPRLSVLLQSALVLTPTLISDPSMSSWGISGGC
ncbi:MAG: hypothetical protein EOM24_07775 [Chloroflexia bacterium]|nr:hypothetical protein [Chloroflexia bacterium]